MIKFNKTWEKELAAEIDPKLQHLGSCENNKELFLRAERVANKEEDHSSKVRVFSNELRNADVELDKEAIRKFLGLD